MTTLTLTAPVGVGSAYGSDGILYAVSGGVVTVPSSAAGALLAAGFYVSVEKGGTGATGASGTGAAGSTGAAGVTGSTGAVGTGLPVGGSTGQFLAKTATTDFAVGWTGP